MCTTQNCLANITISLQKKAVLDGTQESCVLSLALLLTSCQILLHLSTSVFHLILRLSHSSPSLSAWSLSTRLHIQELSKITHQALVKIE